MSKFSGLVCASVMLAIACPALADPQFSALYNFTGGADGAYPTIGLLRAEDGTLYGTTEGEDAKGNFGTVFRLNPPATIGGDWTKDTLYTFQGGKDGAYPWTRLIFDMDTGALLGTTAGDDERKDLGTIFRLVPGDHGALPWKQQIIHRFSGGADSGFPYDALVQSASNGSIYGTAYGNSGDGDYGSIFGFTPDTKHKKWTETLHYNFTAENGNGAYPEAGLILGPAGTLYGTTAGGGNTSAPCNFSQAHGCGTIFSVNIASGDVTFLYQSPGASGDPIFFGYGELLADDQFHLYGTAAGFAPNNCKADGFICGTAFSFDPNDSKPAKTIATFTGNKASGAPYAGMVWDLTHTVLYGTASFGGTHKCPSVGKHKGCGFVFKLVPDGKKWDMIVVHDFTGGADGAKPHDLVMDTEGTLYGEAEFGGSNDVGTIFKIESP